MESCCQDLLLQCMCVLKSSAGVVLPGLAMLV
jgi:hypothetical protein